MYSNRSADITFPATLRDAEGKLLESGSGSVSQENGTVDFKNEFVPLFKMGTPLQIVRMAGELEVHRFCGEVYLSSERLLRLTGVSDEVLPAAVGAFLFDVEITGTAQAAVAAPHEAFRLLRRGGKGHRRQATFPVQIHALSLSVLSFTVGQEIPLEHGQQLTLQVTQPLALEQVTLEVTQVLSFGEGIAGYQCRILELPEASRQNLEEYVGELSRRCKIF